MLWTQHREALPHHRLTERPTYEDQLNGQIEEVIKNKGRGKLEDLFASDDTWTVQ